MITYKKDDLFADKHQFIVHGCNAQGVMGSGFALLIKQRYPAAFEKYRSWCASRTYDTRMGHVVPFTVDGTTILNCITQEYYGSEKDKRYVSYDAVDDCMKYINDSLVWKTALGPWIKMTDVTLAMPMIGAGRGGGKWEVIEQIINHRLADHNVVVYYLDDQTTK